MSRKRTFLAAALGVLGIICLVVAALLPTVIRDNAVRVPTDVDKTAVLAGRGTLIDRTSFTSRTPVQTVANLPVQITTRNQTAPGSSDDTAATTTTVTAARTDLQGQAAVFSRDVLTGTIDRSTYEVQKTPEPTLTSAPATSPSPEPNYIGTLFSFPTNRSQSDYKLYELRGHTPITMKYVDDNRTINGLKTYHFHGEVTGVDTTDTLGVNQQTQITMPAFKWGIPGGAMEPVTMKLFYTNVRDMWVEPTSGVTVDTRTVPRSYYARSANDSYKVDAFAADMRFTEATVNTLADDAKTGRQALRLSFFWTPIILTVVGLILLAVAALLFFRRSRPTTASTTTSTTTQEPPLVDMRN